MLIPLIKICSIITDGTHKTPKYTYNGVPFISIANISTGIYDNNPKYISLDEHKKLIKRCKPEYNDILLCRIGTLGKPFINKLNFDFSIFVSLALIKLIDKSMVDFVNFILESPLTYKYIDVVKIGGGTHTFKINLRDLDNIPIPLPPLKEQERIINKLSKIFSLI